MIKRSLCLSRGAVAASLAGLFFVASSEADAQSAPVRLPPADSAVFGSPVLLPPTPAPPTMPAPPVPRLAQVLGEPGGTPGDQGIADQALRIPGEGRGRAEADLSRPAYGSEAGNTPSDQGIADQALRIAGEGAGRAEFDSFEQRIQALESRFDAEEEASLTSLFEGIDDKFGELEGADDEFADALKGKVTRGTPGATMKIFGRLHLDYWAWPDTDDGAAVLEGGADDPFSPQDRFIWRRARFGIGGDIKDNMFYKAELEAPNPNDLEYRDMYIGFRDLPLLGSLVIGNQKRPFGLDHLNSSRYNVFMERPWVIEGFNEDARRLGIQALNVSEDLRYNWRYGLYNLEKTQDDEGYTGDSYQLQAAARLASTYWWDKRSKGRGYAHWAVAGAFADLNSDGPTYRNEARFRTRPEARTLSRWLNTGRIPGVDTFSLLALEHVVNVGPVQMVGEIQGLWTDRSQLDGTDYDDTFFWGGYAYISYFFTGEHVPWNRESGTIGRVKPFENFFFVRDCNGCTKRGLGAWQIALRYSYADFNDEDIFGGIGSNLTLGLNWYWNPNAKLQFNYIHGAITDSGAGNPAAPSGTLPAVGNRGQAPAVDSNYDLLGTRFVIDF